MRFLRYFLRGYSYVFHVVLSVMGLLLTVFTLASSQLNVEVPWLPWRGPNQMKWVAGTAILGLLCVGLAAAGKLRILFFLYSAAIVYILVRGLFLGPHTFAGLPETHNALLLVSGALLAFFGALPISAARKRA